MSAPAICRVCLVSDVRMHRIESNILLEIYEKLTSTKVRADDGIPNTICYICYSQLLRCHHFSDTARRSDKLLRDQFISGINNVTHNTMLPCPALNLRIVQNLSVTVAQSKLTDNNTNESPAEQLSNRHNSNYLCISEDALIAIKIEVDIKEEMQDEDSIKYEKNALNGLQNREHLLKKNNEINWKNVKDTLTDNKHSSDDLNFYCDVCTKKFVSKTQLQTHMRIHSGIKPFTCSKCAKSFNTVQHLRNHMKNCTSPSAACTLCTKTYSHMSLLNRHMKSHSDEKPYICDRCSSKFKTSTYLKAHMRIHSGERPFACDVCGKAFNQISNLKTHMRIHTGAKSYACDVCGKAFLMNGTLKSHMKCHSGEKPFKCPTCGMTFGFKCSLNQHIRRLHTEVKAYPCSKCSLSFNHEVGLTAHLRSHTADRPYPCDKCKKSFTSARNLKGHSQVHSGERPHACNRCGKAYKRPEHLRQHMKTFKCLAVTMTQQ